MPTVPTTFVPQVAPQVGGDIGQFQAPQVATAENLAAQQEVRFGQAMTQAGNVAYRLGSAIQDDIDDANAKAADTWMLTNATQLLRGENGYLRSVGKNAVDGFQRRRRLWRPSGSRHSTARRTTPRSGCFSLSSRGT